MNRVLFYLLLVVLVTPAKGVAEQLRAIAIWSLFNGEHHLATASLVGEQWSEPELIYRAENLLITPTLVKLSKQQTMAVWSELIGGKTRIRQSTYDVRSMMWTDAEDLIDDGVENLNPNLLNDGRGRLWFFWSGNDGGLDDIFYKTRKLGERDWSEKIQVNPANEVPDYRPEAALDENGDILVRWQTYDFVSGQYVEAQKTFVTAPADNKFLSKTQTDLEIEDIELPDYLPHDSAVTVLFPNNQSAQAIRVR